MEELFVLLKERGYTIGSCESMTAGLFASTLASIPGASAVLRGAIVTYQTAVKTDLVKVDQNMIRQYGVVSEATALQMAVKARVLLGCDICVSISGNAGPDVMEGKPVGMVCIAVADVEEAAAFTLHLHGSRDEIRMQGVEEMTKRVKEFLQK